ncbi:tape measure protein [Halomonas sp. N3-2A]|uniref:tape measure protein n=1 Tax=Halomonas sp. N3-2A TaxID=2014541 RepID=UPI000B5B118A|nr:tape measure protein [Halomonas sp. N3-2A]ASK20705.1 hypothetical protein CEK60_16005 [Halomonas sp. N3-2A]
MNNNLTLSVKLTGDGKQLSGTLRNAQGEVREFGDVSVRDNARATSAFQRTERSVGTVNNQLNEMNQVGRAARNTLLALGGAISVREVIGYSDAWTNAENQLRQVTGTSAELSAIQGELVDIARETRSSYAASANLYARLARSTTELNLTQKDLLGLTTSINKSFATNGATVQEATAAITQLSQGLAAGALRGDEFNSVAEQAPGIMRAIAESLNMTIGELREFASEGGITAEIVVNALQRASDTIDQDFAKTIATFSQNLEVARTNLMQWIGTSGEVTTAVDTLGGSVVTVSEHLDELVTVAQVGAVLLAGRYTGALATATTALAAKTTAAIADMRQSALADAQEQGRIATIARRTAAEQSANASTAQLAAQRAAADRAAIAQDAQRLVSTQAALAAERALETQRLQAQISATGRMLSHTRLAEIRASETAITNQLTAANARLTQAEAAEVSAKRLATAASVEKARADTVATAAMGGYISAARAATTANSLLAASGRAAAGALALVGGPVGAAVIAAGAIYYFRDELGLTVPKIDANTTAVNRLTNGLDNMSQAAAQLTLTSLVGQLAQLKALAEVTNETIQEVQKDDVTPTTGGFLGYSGEELLRQNEAFTEIGETSRETKQEIANVEAAIALVEDRLGTLGERNREVEPTITNVGDASKAAADKAKELAKSTEAQADALEDLYNRLIPGRRETVQLARDMQTLTLAMAMGTGNIGQNIQAIGLLQQQYIEAQNDTDDLADKTVKAAFTMEGAWDEVRLNGLRRLDDGFGDLWEGAIDGSLNAGEVMKRGLNQTLAEMAQMTFSRPITVQLATSMGFGGSSSAGGQPAGGSQSFGGMPSLSGMMNGSGAIANAYRAFQGTGSTYAGTFGSELAVQTEGGLRAGFKSFAASGLGNAALGIGGGLAGGYAGTAIGSAVFGKNANSNYGAMGGAALGQALIPIPGLGAAIGGALGGVVDSLFGSSKKTFDFDFKQGGNYGVFGDRQGALGDFGVTSFSDFKMDQQDELQELMNSIADFDNVLAAAAIPDRLHAMKESVDGFAYSGPEGLFDARLREIIDGSGAYVEKAIAAIADPEQMANAFVSVLNLERITQSLNAQIQSDVVGHLEANTGDIQGTAASLTQAINATVLLGNSAQRLNLQFDDTAGGAIHYAWSMQEAVGGMESLNNMSNSYFQNYFTAAEREAMHREELTRSMQELGFELPKTRDGFRELMEAQNLNTTAGVQNAAALMQLEGAFAQLTPAVSEVGDAVRSTSDILQERAQLERELLQAQGDTNALRQLDLEALDESNRALQQMVWAEEKAAEDRRERERQAAQDQRDAAAAARDAAQAYADAIRTAEQAVQSAKQQVQQSYQRFDQQSFDLQINYLELLGDGEQALAMQRERELQTIDDSLRPFQERLWALQDEAKAQQQAREASRNYVSELERVRGELSGAMGNINGWIDQQNATSGTPEMNLANAQEQLARQLVLAENGDRSALQGITQYADRVLQANDAYNASSSAGQRVESDVINALKGLPKALSAEEFLAKEITDKLGEVITSFDDMIKLSLADEIERAVFASQYTIGTLIDFAVGSNDLPEDLRTVLGSQAHRLDSTINYLIGTNELDQDDRALALNVSNNLVSTVDQLLGSELTWTDKRLALNTTNTLSSTIDLTLGSDVSKETRKLALLNGNTLIATIDAVQSPRITADTRALALNQTNSIATDVNALLSSTISADAKALALNAYNDIATTVHTIIASDSSAAAMNMALNSTNTIRTFVRGLEHRLTDEDAKAMALNSSNTLTATIQGVMASSIDDNAKKLALSKTNQLTTTIKAALADGQLSRDERRLIDTQSETVVKTLKTSGGLNLTTDEWAVINAASGTQRLQLLADVAFGRTDLDHLKDIDDNTKPLAERAQNQLARLNGLVREMTESTSQLVDLNGSMISLSDAIAQLRSVMSSRASETSVRDAANATVGKLTGVESKANSSAISNRSIADFFKRAGNPNWGLRVSMSYHQDVAAVRSFGYHAAKEMRNEFNSNGLRVAIGWGHSLSGINALASAWRNQFKSLGVQGFALGGTFSSGVQAFANGGAFTNQVVSSPTLFNMGLMGEAGPEAIMPLTRHSNGSLGVRAELPALPSFPLLGKNDVADLLRDLKREVAELRKENAKLQGESNKHLAAANNQRGAAAKGQIGAIERGNKMLKKLEEDKRMQVAKR